MAVTEAQVLDALRPVQDPELNLSIVEIGMVKDIRIDGGSIGVTIALTVPGCPLRAEITKRVTDAVMPLGGVDSVDVDMTVMTPEELEGVRARLGNGGGARGQSHAGHSHAGGAGHGQSQQPLGHEEGRTNAFMLPESRTRVLGISSGKGGVGKSSVTVNTAIALAKMGHQVAILDADVYGFSVPKMLGITQDPVVIDDMIVPPLSHGVKVISIGFFVDDD